MTLTDADRAVIEYARREWSVDADGSEDATVHAYIAGKAIGRAEAIAEAARVIRGTSCYSPAQAQMYLTLAAAIEALADA